MYRSLKVNTLATNPLFTTAEAKDFLKVDTTADDTLIDNLIKAATQSCDVSKPARIGLAVDGELPTLADRINAVEVKYTVGYGTASTDVPDGIKQAVLLTLGNFYENRQTVITGRTATELPLSSQYLLNQYKIQVC